MTKILDSTFSTTIMAKYVELRKGVLINGQYHLKENMQAVPFNQVFFNQPEICDGTRMLYTDKCLGFKDYQNNAYFPYNKIEPRIVYDKVDPDICYVMTLGIAYTYILKFIEKDNTCKLVKSFRLTNDSSGIAYGFDMYEKDNLLYAITGQANAYMTLHKIDKETLASTFSCTIGVPTSSSSYAYATACKVTDNLYYSTGYATSGFGYYSEKQNQQISHSINIPGSSTNVLLMNINDTIYETEEEIKVVAVVPNNYGTGQEIQSFRVVTFDKVNEKWVNGNNIVPDVSKDPNHKPNNFNVSNIWEHDLFSRTINGRTFIFVYQRANSTTGSVMWTYELKTIQEEVDGQTVSKDIIEKIKTQNFPAGQSGPVIYYREDEKLRFYGRVTESAWNSLSASIFCYELNEVTLEFEKTLSIEGRIRDFGLDKERNLYVCWSDNSISKYNNRTVANFNAKFENGLYEYKGEDIETNLIISTSNLEGQLIAKEVKLDLKGNAKFKATDNKSITVNTLTTGDVNIPVVITGAGSLNIFPKIKA